MEKPAEVDFPVLDVIRRRWSPRSFSSRPVEPHKMRCLLEAARWAASSYNEQPWRFIVAFKSDETEFRKALGCLVEANQAWAHSASVLVLTCASTTFSRNGKSNRVALHALGAAAANISLQATAMGLFVHQMAGVDVEKVRSTYNVPEGFEPQTAIAIGYGGEAGELPDNLRDMEQAPRNRKPLNEIVFAGSWGEVAPVVLQGETCD